MHETQAQLLTLIKSRKKADLGVHSLRQIAKFIGQEGKPQVVKYHLGQLEKAGLIQLDLAKGVIKPVKRGFAEGVKSVFYSIPIVGSANCGPQTIFAEERTEGYLKVSSTLLPKRRQDLYALVASGSSMNKAKVRGNLTIEDGDFVIVDKAQMTPKDGDIIVAVIDGMATIKRYKLDREEERILLEADSTESYTPIMIHPEDDFQISGKVIDIIKKK
jgi:repressor LexA